MSELRGTVIFLPHIATAIGRGPQNGV